MALGKFTRTDFEWKIMHFFLSLAEHSSFVELLSLAEHSSFVEQINGDNCAGFYFFSRHHLF